jgi:hypothetical protein
LVACSFQTQTCVFDFNLVTSISKPQHKSLLALAIEHGMKAVVFKGPGKVVIEDRPIPKIQDAGDIIVKVEKVHVLMNVINSY